MEINKLEDKDILDFLMVSDFENLNPEELRFLLLKFRYFYRISSTKNQHYLSDIEFIKNHSDRQIKELKTQLNKIGIRNKDYEIEINKIKNKKLTLSERFAVWRTGKIKIENEFN